MSPFPVVDEAQRGVGALEPCAKSIVVLRKSVSLQDSANEHALLSQMNCRG